MKAFSSFFISSLIHLSLALTAFQYQGPIRNEEAEVYTLDFILDKENHVIDKKITTIELAKKNVEVKKMESEKNTKAIAKENKKTIDPRILPPKEVVTQIQESPVQINKKSPPDPIAKKISENIEVDKNKKVFASKQAEPQKNIPLELKTQVPAENNEPSVALNSKTAPSVEPISQVKDARLLSQKSGNIPPEYSSIDRINKQTGKVVVLGYVNKAGEVGQVQVIENSGTRSMAENVLSAFKSYRFQENQEGWVKMPYEFILEGESKVLSTRQRHLYQNIKR